MEAERHLALLALDQLDLPLGGCWRSHWMNSMALPTVAESNRVRTRGGKSPSDSSQTTPRSGSVKLWNSSITTALSWLKSNASRCSKRFRRISATTTRTRASGFSRRLPVTRPDVVRMESPPHGRRLHLVELLLRQGDQRRGVVGRRAGVQGLEQRRLGDQRLARARRRADQYALFGREPGQQGLFLDRIGRVRELVEIARGQFVARKRLGGHGKRPGIKGGRGSTPCHFARISSSRKTRVRRSITSDRHVRSPVRKSSNTIGDTSVWAAISASERLLPWMARRSRR